MIFLVEAIKLTNNSNGRHGLLDGPFAGLVCCSYFFLFLSGRSFSLHSPEDKESKDMADTVHFMSTLISCSHFGKKKKPY